MTPELRPLFDAQRAASLRDQAPPWSVRADRLRRLRALVREHRAAIAAAISADFSNRPRQETELAEVYPRSRASTMRCATASAGCACAAAAPGCGSSPRPRG